MVLVVVLSGLEKGSQSLNWIFVNYIQGFTCLGVNPFHLLKASLRKVMLSFAMVSGSGL